jgi:hypothetical protein
MAATGLPYYFATKKQSPPKSTARSRNFKANYKKISPTLDDTNKKCDSRTMPFSRLPFITKMYRRSL